MGDRRLLVVGAREGSLGAAVYDAACQYEHFEHVTTADGRDDAAVAYKLDVRERRDCVSVLEQVRPTDIVCTVGINMPDGPDPGSMIRNMSLQLQTNVWGPMQLLAEAIDLWVNRSGLRNFNFVGISSNSAHIARSESAGYCASKAALSIALRSVARRYAHLRYLRIWGYEPGWIAGTPMSDEVRMHLPPNISPHRIPGGGALSKEQLAHRIVSDLRHWDAALNGCMIRLDGGEQ